MIVFMLVVLGLCMGSFVEASSWRIHEQATRRKLSAKAKRDLSIMQGRSMCAQCHHQLRWYDLIPLVSWISLGGKCRYCAKPIGWHAPLLEVTAALLFAVSYAYWPLTLTTSIGMTWLTFGLWLLAVVYMLLLAVYDLRWMLLPNKLVAQLFGLSIAFIVSREAYLGVDIVTVWQLLGSVAVTAGLFWVLYQLSDGRWIGGGDVKLAVPLAIFIAEPIRAALMLFVASLLGSVVGVALIARGGRRQTLQIPFGPFLIAATYVVVLFGDNIVDLYLKTALGT